MSLAATTVSFGPSAFVPLALGFFGLGVGYLIYGPQELVGYPPRDRRVDVTTGIWGIRMPGFLQFVTGILLFVGLTCGLALVYICDFFASLGSPESG